MKKKLFFAVCFALALSLLPTFGLFYETTQQWNDLLYQETSVTYPDICIIGIDAESIETLGSFPFEREIFADLLTILNESDSPPLAIAVDVLFTGESNEESDAALVEAVANWDNILLACSGNYGTALVMDTNNQFYLSNSALLSMNYPFSPLKEVAQLAHINSSLDGDGILRHGILTIDNEEGEKIPSLALAMYEKYCESKGISVENLPNEQWYIPFTAKTGGYYDGYSLSKVLSGEIPPSVFANKMVFIGPYTVGLQDHFYTAIDRNNIMYGVEFQANALESLIAQEFIVEVDTLSQTFFLIAISFTLFLLTIEMKLQFSACMLLSITGSYVILCKQLYENGILVDVFYLPFSCLFLFLFHIIVNAVRERMERGRVTATFRRYVAPEVVDQIFKEGADTKLGGTKMAVSVLFVDVRNFTPMSEKYAEEPEKVVDILNRLLDSMAVTIMNNGGTLDKFIGDAIMCFWGAPLPQEDYIYLSVKTAIEITENIEPIIQEIKNIHQHDVSVGIGIQCGDAVVGNIGSKNRMDFTVIGDTVNTAARLESNAKGAHNMILISEDVYKKVSDRVVTEQIVGGLELKGKTGTEKDGRFTAYQVLGKKNTISSP